MILLVSGAVFAQPPAAAPTPVKVAIDSAIANQIKVNEHLTGWSVFITFTKAFVPTDGAQAEKPGNYRIINANSGSQVPISEASFVAIPGASLNVVRLVIPSAGALNEDDFFYLFALNLVFNGAPAESVPTHKIELEVDKGQTVVDEKGTDNAGANAHNPPKPAWGFGKAKGRDDSDLYIAYELTKARSAATTGSGDLKIAIPFLRNFWGKTSRFSPLVDVKASSDAGADPDSLKFAFEWLYPLYLGNNSKGAFPYNDVYLLNSAKVEAPKNFNNINALWENKWLFPSMPIPRRSKSFKMFLDFFAGAELGKNLKSPLPAAEGKGLARLMAGANLSIQVPVKNVAALRGFEFTSSFIRRWPLKRELLVDKDTNGNLVGLALSKGPKDYSDSKFIIKVNDYFGPYIGYEWGRLPPNYELVDHKWTFGLLFKSKVRAGGE
jgi:hypothetical protein